MLSTKIPFDSERSLALRTENGVIRRLMRIETNASVTLKKQKPYGQRYTDGSDKNKSGQKTAERKQQIAERVIIKHLGIIKNGFDFAGNIAGHLFGKKRRLNAYAPKQTNL